MSTAANLRFLFDTDFRAPASPAPRAPEETFEPKVDKARIDREAAQAAELEAAREEAYARGRTEAQKATGEREDARFNMLLERIDAQLGAVAADIQARMAGIEGAAARLGVEAACKLAPALVASQPETEIAAFFARAMKDFVDAPTLDIRLSPADADKAGKLLGKLAAAGGYEGQMRVRPDDALAQGDCVIGWGDGGTRREMAGIEEGLRAMLAEHFDLGEEDR